MQCAEAVIGWTTSSTSINLKRQYNGATLSWSGKFEASRFLHYIVFQTLIVLFCWIKYLCKVFKWVTKVVRICLD